MAEWTQILNSGDVPINTYRVIGELECNLDKVNSIVTHDAGAPRDTIMIPSQKGLFEMNPGVRRGLEGRRPRDAGCWPHRTICALRTSVIPVVVPLPWLRAPGGSCGAAPSCGRDRRYRPDRPLSRVLHLHQACMDHPLEVARQRLQVDGKPHPTAPSHPQAPKPVGRASARSSFPRSRPLWHTACAHSSVASASGAARCLPSPGPP